VPAVGWLICGILLALGPRSGLPGARMLAVAVAGGLLLTVRPARLRWFALLVPVGLLWTVLQVAAPWRTYPRHLPRPTCRVWLRGVCVTPPSGTEDKRFLCRLRTVSTWEHAARSGCRGLVLVMPGADGVAPDYGDVVEVIGTIQPPPAGSADALFNYGRYLWTRGIVHVVRAEATCPVGQDGVRRWLAPVYRLRERLADALGKGLRDRKQQAILQAMTLGYRRRLPDDVREDFVRGSTIHVFAISGLHVGIVALLGSWLLATLGVPTRVRGVLLILAVGVYVFMCGAAASAVRAWLMLACWWGARLLRRPRVPLNAIAGAALLSLLWQPLALLQTGFLFSFTVVVVLVAGWPVVTDHMRILGERVWWLPPGLRQHRWGRWRLRPVWLLATSALAWLGSAGNGLLVPAGTVLNLGVIGLCPFILGASAAKILVSLLGVGFLANWLARGLSALVNALQALGSLGPLPGASVRICPLPPLLALAYYGLLFVLLRRRQAVRRRLAVLAALLGLLLAPTAWHRTVRPADRVLAGDGCTMPALLLRTRAGLPPVVVNTGATEGSRRLSGLLEREGADGIEALACTSGRWDAAGDAKRFLARWRPRTLVVPDNWRRSRALMGAVNAQLARGGRLRVLGDGGERTLRAAGLVVAVTGPVPEQEIRVLRAGNAVLTVRKTGTGILRVESANKLSASFRRRSDPVDVRIPATDPPAGNGD
jgi:ComEC/Rec2-related protein